MGIELNGIVPGYPGPRFNSQHKGTMFETVYKDPQILN